MYTNKIRHLMVALGLVAVATAASAATYVSHTHRATVPAAVRGAAPVVSGDLGEVVVHAAADLGEVIVRAPHDLGDVLVQVAPVPAAGALLAEVEVTASRAGDARYSTDTAGVATLAVAR